MKFISDFHIHSHFSLATSKQLVPEYLEYWAKIKGISVVGTGDFTHPGWLKELKEKLIPAEEGLYRLKDERRLSDAASLAGDVYFMLTAEISNIYKKGGKVRKVHNILFAPDIEVVEKFQEKLRHLSFNITSDGRPILGLDSRDLLEIALDIDPRIFFVPAHIWTPWFSVLGAKSGFDSVTECFGDLSGHIFAVETGLSTDPPLNWMCSFLDKYTLISNSDAHSPEKLGRNANIFNTSISYPAIIEALKTGSPETCLGTIDMFPQEGKYHYDGHRKCRVCWSPVETLEHNGMCNVCRKKITVGVTSRIAQLSDREDISQRPGRLPFHSIIPLKEILAEIKGVSPNTKSIDADYFHLIKKAGNEFSILLDLSIEEIKKAGGEVIAEAIQRMRGKEVYISEGFDGEYGQIKVFKKGEVDGFGNEKFLFDKQEAIGEKPPQRPLLNFDLKLYRELLKTHTMEPGTVEEGAESYGSNQKGLLKGLNKEQSEAVQHIAGPAMIIAGPGTGKTKVLTVRIAHLVLNGQVAPENILAITFTNKAAEEMRERANNLLGNKDVASLLTISTFHALGYQILQENIGAMGRDKHFSIINQEDRLSLISSFIEKKDKLKAISQQISNIKQQGAPPEDIREKGAKAVMEKYQELLAAYNAFDLDDLLYQTLMILKNNPGALERYRNKYQHILVDEYQDVNSVQYQLIRLLAEGEQANICVIGDPNQAIYGFRGADVKYIRQFTEDYPQLKIYFLKKSYRCSNRILKASENVVQAGNEGIVLEGLQKGVKIKIVPEASEKSEAEFVARSIENMIGGVGFFSMDSKIAEGTEDAEIKSLSDFGILCRTARQMQFFEKALRDHNIPYQLVGEETIFEKQPFASITDLAKLSLNPENKLLENKLKIKKIIYDNEANAWASKPFTSVEELIQSIMEEKFKGKTEGLEQEANLLLSIARQFGNDAHSFIKYVSLGTGADMYKPNIENVTIMTLHAAKGLEFNCVFVTGCEDGLIPYSLFENQKSDIEEEKRLLYVGMTRAKKYLFLTHAYKRFLMGKDYFLARSPFLDRIEKDLIEIQKQTVKKKQQADKQLKLF